MPELIKKASSYLPLKQTGSMVDISAEQANWDYISFELVKLTKNQHFQYDTLDQEVCLVLLSGHISAKAGQEHWEHIGNREQIFERKKPYAVYAPPKTNLHIQAITNVEIALCKAPAEGKYPTRLILPDDISMERRGSGKMERIIHNILSESAVAEHLLVVEVFTPEGNWSSFPPHKHDELRLPEETKLEEIYYHRMTPTTGFAFQRVYTDDRTLDESFAIEDQDIVFVPKGYHPVATTPGTELYYLNVMAGPVRQWKFTNEPNFERLIQS
ncbi:5-deoxy-glucuronate isomerase [Shimazuella kribbensis]|uniref:5-deoxy-glucuronate isomerase n=1 Tax=Shimazuella kribbensis TaxID=139808 RepID=UPI00041D8E5B|nr:5-deoxy-glucuronate isomerase [Shimazuella kribbensis]